MSVKDYRIQEIRERLSKVNPYPWRLGRGYEQYEPGLYVEDIRGHVIYAGCSDSDSFSEDFREENLDMIAHAPSDIAFLLNIIDQAEHPKAP